MEDITRIIQLLREYDNTRKKYQKLLRDGGWHVTGPQVGVLRIVALKPGISVSGLAEMMGVHVTTAEGYAKRLFKLGYVQLNEDSADRRRKIITITDSGARIINEVPLGFKSLLTHNMLKAGSKDKQKVLAGLELLIKYMEEDTDNDA
jgi:DNA-binding MarR family transcriptional regulator